MVEGFLRHKYLLCLSTVLINGSLLANVSVAGEYLVKLKPAYSQSLDNLAQSWGAEVNVVSRSQSIIKVKKSMLERADYTVNELKNSPAVELVEPNYIYTIVSTPNDTDYSKLWGLKNSGQEISSTAGLEGMDIAAEQAWDLTKGSRDIVVAIIDTGIDYNHEDLKDNIWTNEAELNGEAGVDDDGNGFVDDIHGYDFANNDGDPMDDNKHGTHCAGTIGASGDNNLGVVGVAWKVRMMGVKFLTGGGSGSLENAIKSIDYATSHGVDIMSNSWGGGSFSELLKESIERAKEAGILFVAAAGNSSSNNDSNPAYPASYDVDNIVSVGASTNQGGLAYFSNYGKESVHVIAPGHNIYSTVPGNKYAMLSGTSMATPHVSGIAVLVKSFIPELDYSEIKDRMIRSSKSRSSFRNKAVANGHINAFYALINLTPEPDANDPYYWQTMDVEVSTPHPYPVNYEDEFVVDVPGASHIALYFSDFNLENRYDKLTVEDEDGNKLAEYTGNIGESFSDVFSVSKVVLKVKADKSVQKYGFDITKVAYKMAEPPSEEPPAGE